MYILYLTEVKTTLFSSLHGLNSDFNMGSESVTFLFSIICYIPLFFWTSNYFFLTENTFTGSPSLTTVQNNPKERCCPSLACEVAVSLVTTKEEAIFNKDVCAKDRLPSSSWSFSVPRGFWPRGGDNLVICARNLLPNYYLHTFLLPHIYLAQAARPPE